jgi:spore maturation protein CgeB
MGAGYPNRRTVFSDLLDYDLKIWGTEWDLDSRLGGRVQARGRRVSTEETALIFNAAKINLNLHSSVFVNGIDREGGFINPRTFEIASCGAFQLVDRRHPLGEHFDLQKEMAVFDHINELKEKINFFLNHPEKRNELADRARERVLAEHTYRHRMETMLHHIAQAGYLN